MDAIRRRTIIIRILACVMAVLVLGGVIVSLWSANSVFYTEEQHLYRIKKRAERRFLKEGSGYTGLEVYPLYNKNDEFGYALIELEPQGYVYVGVGGFDSPLTDMYTLSELDPMEPGTIWRPYVNEEGAVSVVPDFLGDGVTRTFEGRRYFKDGDEYLGYYVSPYKVANIQNERRYFITLIDDSSGYRNDVGTIPAVKRGDNYIDLVSGREIPCSTDFGDETLQPLFETIHVAFFVGRGL